jgi:hypothetical protein
MQQQTRMQGLSTTPATAGFGRDDTFVLSAREQQILRSAQDDNFVL